MANNYKYDNRAAALRALDGIEEAERGFDAQDEERARRRRERILEMKRRKERQLLIRKLAVPVFFACVICAALAVGAVKLALNKSASAKSSEDKPVFSAGISLVGTDITSAFFGLSAQQTAFIEENGIFTLGGTGSAPVLSAVADENTIGAVGGVVSEYAVFIDVEEGRILAQKQATVRISPASMTKILTVLVAAEHITDADDTFEITREITDYSYSNGCSSVGFEVGEVVTVNDLFYGTILPSGADAAVGLATYVAGSHEAFVELMNEKLEELGLSETTHFTNCVGLYDEEHYSTVYDMAVILKAAYDNAYCREVLSTHMYTTSATAEHPDGITLSNLFLRRIEDSDTHGEVLCAKTGFVVQSKNCAASLSVGNDGKLYICVTANSTSAWRCIYDHVAFYQYFLPE